MLTYVYMICDIFLIILENSLYMRKLSSMGNAGCNLLHH